jgi:hypothetical protein
MISPQTMEPMTKTKNNGRRPCRRGREGGSCDYSIAGSPQYFHSHFVIAAHVIQTECQHPRIDEAHSPEEFFVSFVLIAMALGTQWKSPFVGRFFLHPGSWFPIGEVAGANMGGFRRGVISA